MRLDRFVLAALVLAAASLAAPPAYALRVVTWNLIDYPNTALASRQPALRTVVGPLNADIIAIQELKSEAGRDSFLNNVLNVVEPGQWAASPFLSTTESAFFYKTAKVALNFTGPVSTAGPRDVLLCRFRPVGYLAATNDFRVYSLHFKAGTPVASTTDSTTRRLESTDLRATINLAAAGTQFLIGGDYNFYGDWEGGYTRLTESTSDNDGRAKDPLALPGTWNQFNYRFHHSQSTCSSGCLTGTYATGGLDDRFDFWLSSYNLQDGEGLDVLPGTTFPFGNDGNHYNASVNGGGTNSAVGITVANALFNASDHLPVVVDLQVAAKIAAASAITFGSAIVGGVAQQNLNVANPAIAPADELDYSFAAPAGFSAPGGSFQAFANLGPNPHTLGMNTAAAGVKTGTLVMTTDDRDSLTKNVLLSGTVLNHAAASLDSAAIVTTQTLDFGTHAAGAFPLLPFRAHDFGYNSLQARLSLDAATISPAGSRFSLTQAFTPGLIGAAGRTFTAQFDAAGATPDSTYQDTLRIVTSDEPLPGATAQATLTVVLRARTESGTVDVPGSASLALRFLAPRPNPLLRETTFGFDLPREAEVSLEVFDLSGRRVAAVARGAYPAGSHRVRWTAVSEDGSRLGAGLYFARFRSSGLDQAQRLIVLP